MPLLKLAPACKEGNDRELHVDKALEVANTD